MFKMSTKYPKNQGSNGKGVKCKFHPITAGYMKSMSIGDIYRFSIKNLSKLIADFELLNFFEKLYLISTKFDTHPIANFHNFYQRQPTIDISINLHINTSSYINILNTN